MVHHLFNFPDDMVQFLSRMAHFLFSGLMLLIHQTAFNSPVFQLL